MSRSLVAGDFEAAQKTLYALEQLCHCYVQPFCQLLQGRQVYHSFAILDFRDVAAFYASIGAQVRLIPSSFPSQGFDAFTEASR